MTPPASNSDVQLVAPTRVLRCVKATSPSTARVKGRLESVLGRLHAKLDKINGAESIPAPSHKATRNAQAAWKGEDLEDYDAA